MEQVKASDEVPVAVADELSIVLAQEKLPKPEELATLYATRSGDALA